MQAANLEEPRPQRTISHLARLEAEAMHILREAVAEAGNPIMLFSAGKDRHRGSTRSIMASVTRRSCAPNR